MTYLVNLSDMVHGARVEVLETLYVVVEVVRTEAKSLISDTVDSHCSRACRGLWESVKIASIAKPCIPRQSAFRSF
jgi:hypothetical protein